MKRWGYRCVVSNDLGNDTSNPATLSVLIRPPDFDDDGDVDQVDFGYFQACLTGPAVSQPDPACLLANLDGDSDVDQNDFGIFQGCISGPDYPVDPDCAE